MSKRLYPNNPFLRFLAMIGNLMLLNVLFMVTSIPVVTIGAALAAMNRIAQNILSDQETTIVKEYFRAFSENFKQATIVWLVVLVWLIVICLNALVVMALLPEDLRVLCSYFLSFVAVVILAILIYLFPLIARYENNLTQHIKNAVLLAIGNLPRTLLLTVLNALPFCVVLKCPIDFVFQLAFYWALIGASLFCIISYILLRPVFSQFEPERDSIEGEN